MPKTGQVRIIGGKWRGRRIAFPDAEGLRPSPDRVRETAFNWIGPKIRGARCLDLFSGSGVLGLEALSRGAQSVTLVDQSNQVIAAQEKAIDQLQTEEAAIVKADVITWLDHKPEQPYDIIFLDPPFHQQKMPVCLEKIQHNHWLTPNGWVYAEAEATHEAIPEGQWVIHRSKVAGQVRYHILQLG